MSKETPSVTIDGKQYDLKTLSKSAKTNLLNLKITDEEIKRLKMQIGIAQAARGSFATRLQAELKGVKPM